MGDRQAAAGSMSAQFLFLAMLTVWALLIMVSCRFIGSFVVRSVLALHRDYVACYAVELFHSR
jgi:hypothetical protein